MNEKICDKIIRKIRGNLVVRFIMFPYMNNKKKKEFKEYLQSEDSEKLKFFSNIHEGKRCFIIGNGPSLLPEDLDKLTNEITLCGNRIYNIFEKTKWRPTYYFSIDNDGMKEIVRGIENVDVGMKFLAISAKKYIPENSRNVIFINHTNKKFIINRYNDKRIHISEDVSQYFSCGYTVLFVALQFAIYAGIKEIYLLGVDFNYSYVTNRWGITRKNSNVKDYFDEKKYFGSYLNYESTMHAWKVAKEYCDIHHIKIFNATRGGQLEVFERVDFDRILMQ